MGFNNSKSILGQKQDIIHKDESVLFENTVSQNVLEVDLCASHEALLSQSRSYDIIENTSTDHNLERE